MYAKKYFDIDCLKKTNLQNEIGVYYITRADNIKEEYYNYFDIDKNDMVDMVYLTTNDFDKVIDTNDIEYSYTDNDEIETFLADLMNYEKLILLGTMQVAIKYLIIILIHFIEIMILICIMLVAQKAVRQ